MSDNNENLEVKVAFLEDSLATLSDEFFAQQKELDKLKSQVTLLVEKLRNVQQADDNPSEVLDERPPHY